MDPKKFPQIM